MMKMTRESRALRALRLANDPLGLAAYADALEEDGAPADEVRRWRMTSQWWAVLVEMMEKGRAIWPALASNFQVTASDLRRLAPGDRTLCRPLPGVDSATINVLFQRGKGVCFLRGEGSLGMRGSCHLGYSSMARRAHYLRDKALSMVDGYLNRREVAAPERTG
jgi:hypothetical protein